MDATLLLRHWAWVGWGGILTFMYLAYTHGCYAAATSLGMGGVGGVTFMYLAYTRGCYAAATSLGMGGVGGILTFVRTWMLRCCYVTGHGWGGGDINVHVPCVHTWMLRCCYVTGHGWGGGDINVHVPCVHMWARANSWNTWRTCCRRIDAIRWRKKETSPCIDKVVTSFQKSMKIIVSLRRKHHFANFPMEFSHGMCIHLRLEKSSPNA